MLSGVSDRWFSCTGVPSRSAQFRRFRQLGYSPSSSEGLDQQHARVHATPQDVDVVSFILQRDGLCRENVKVGIGSADITIIENLQRFLRGGRRLLLLLRFLAEDSQGDEIVFHLLKSCERALAIAGNGCVIVGACGG